MRGLTPSPAVINRRWTYCFFVMFFGSHFPSSSKRVHITKRFGSTKQAAEWYPRLALHSWNYTRDITSPASPRGLQTSAPSQRPRKGSGPLRWGEKATAKKQGININVSGRRRGAKGHGCPGRMTPFGFDVFISTG